MMQRALSFDWQAYLEEATFSTGVGFESGKARTGTYALYFLASGVADFAYWWQLPFRTAKDEFYYQFALQFNGSITATRTILTWRSGATTLGGLKLNTSGNLEVWTGNLATLVGTGTKVLSVGQIFVIELYIKIADSGAITLRVDLTPDVTFTGDTKPGAETTVDNFKHGNYGAASSRSYISDVILNDLDDTDGLGNTSWPGGAHVSLLRPTSDGATLQWTPTPGGNHYSTVDEAPSSAADNLKSLSVGDIDDLNLADLSGLAQAVRQIKFEAFARKASADPPSRLAMGLDIGVGGVLWSQDLNLPTSSGHIYEYYQGDPTVAEVNAGILKLKSAT